MGEPRQLSIAHLLTFYHEEVVSALAAALTIDDNFPEEVLNEIRNALTHIAAAHVHENDKAKVQHELHAAKRHLKRVCVDCFKVCISTIAIRSEDAIKRLTYECQLPNDVYQRMAELRRQRKGLAAAEGNRTLELAIEGYKDLFNKYDEFYVSLDKNFAGQTAEMRSVARRWREWKGYIIGFGGGLVVPGAGYAFANWPWLWPF